MRAGGRNISYRHEPNSGALVQKSQYNDVVYSVDCGWIRAESTASVVKIFYGGNIIIIDKFSPSKREFKATVGGKNKVFVVDVNGTGAYGRMLENGLIVGRYTF